MNLQNKRDILKGILVDRIQHDTAWPEEYRKNVVSTWGAMLNEPGSGEINKLFMETLYQYSRLGKNTPL